MQKIDFVITWVDGSDKEWQEKKAKYSADNNGGRNGSTSDNRAIRYRDMDCLKYWFRGIEEYAPWVNKIYFVTCGQKPEWLNEDNKKLVFVNHQDIIPKEYLPTFNSNAIEPFIYRIKGLSDKFVYFNDDMFIVNKTKPTDFFAKSLPRDVMTLSPIITVPEDKFHKKLCNNIEIINRHFNFEDCYKKNRKKYLSLKQGKYWFRSTPLLNYGSFVGFKDYHLPISYLKHTFEDVWRKESAILEKTASFKFRNNEDSVNHWLFQYWQFARGEYCPRNNSRFGKSIFFNDKKINDYINHSRYKVLCINDCSVDEKYDYYKTKLIKSFEIKFPKKSSFER